MGRAGWKGRRARRVALLVAAWILLATVVRPGPVAPPRGPALASVRIEPVALDEEEPARRRVGGLVFRGGWALSSEDWRFGAISGMHVEGDEVSAVSDAGILLRFAVPDRAGAAQVRIDPLREVAERAAGGKSGRDSEALLVAGGQAWVAYEARNRIVRFSRPGWAIESAAHPPAMARWGGNRGPEALVRLADGRFLALAEGSDDSTPTSEALLFDGDPAAPGTKAAALRYARPSGYRATDAALLPDGRLLVLNRRHRWLRGFSAALVVADIRGLGEGATIAGRLIAELRAPLSVDNMEALSVTVEGGRTIVWIASDDNFNPLQRTLLLKFELTAPPSPRRRPG